MPDTIDAQVLIDEVRRIAYERPEFIYKGDVAAGCVYVHEGAPSCLIGHALWNLKLIDADFEDACPDDLDLPCNSTPITRLITQRLVPVTATPAQKEWLSWVQEYQDNESPWGTATAQADKDMNEG